MSKPLWKIKEVDQDLEGDTFCPHGESIDSTGPCGTIKNKTVFGVQDVFLESHRKDILVLDPAQSLAYAWHHDKLQEDPQTLSIGNIDSLSRQLETLGFPTLTGPIREKIHSLAPELQLTDQAITHQILVLALPPGFDVSTLPQGASFLRMEDLTIAR